MIKRNLYTCSMTLYVGCMICFPVNAQNENNHDYGAENSARIIARAEDAVRDHLKDPESARFSNETVNSFGMVCGMVNSKNSYGGYSGRQMFIVSLDRNTVRFEPSPATRFSSEHYFREYKEWPSLLQECSQ